MKKILITTTALASLVAGAAFADAPTVAVGGSLDFQAAIVGQKSAYKTVGLPNSPNKNSYKFKNKAGIFVSATSKSDTGVIFGANVALAPKVEQNNDYKDGKTEKTYLFIESSAGRVELGNNYSVSRLLRVDASSIARATGGASYGDWNQFIGFPSQTNTTLSDLDFLWSGDNILASDAQNPQLGVKENQRKISWISPRYSGFQFGLSYAPDGANFGDGTLGVNPAIAGKASSTATSHSQVKNLWSVAANYAQTYDSVNVALAATYDRGSVNNSANTIKLKKLSSYSVGGAIGSSGVTVAASYGSDGKSLQPIGVPGVSKYWTAGIAYEDGPFGGSLTYFQSKRGLKSYAIAPVVVNGYTHNVSTADNVSKVKAYSVGVDYKVAPGVVPYAEVTFFNAKPSNASGVTPNKGTVVLLGTGLSF